MSQQSNGDLTDTRFPGNTWSQRELEVKVNDNALTGNAFSKKESEEMTNNDSSATAAPDSQNKKMPVL